MAARKCIYCGCTDDHACRISVADITAQMAKELAARPGRLTQQMPTSGTMACWWISLKPPVCSAPACRAKMKQTRGGGRKAQFGKSYQPELWEIVPARSAD